ncbi:MAG: hypothetical protein HYT87_12595, partial [Nitrospirae bacterium]|nr:hypothetical protein [Nitrospirota bacterium]
EDEDPARAKTLYWRGKEFGWRSLMENKCFKKRFDAKPANPDWYDLAQCFTKKQEAQYLVWTAAAWGGWLKLSMQEEDASFEIFFDAVPVREFMDRARVLDENYYYGMPLLFFGILYTQMPPMAGGGRDKAEETFQKAFRVSDGRFLLAKVMYARFLLVAIKDREAFTKTLKEVIEAPDDLLPEARLANAIAKRKATFFLSRMNELF